MLKLQHLTKRFGAAPLFTDLCMEVDAPVVLWAPSGWGKTTLLRILMGLEAPTSGSVEGVGRVGVVFQEDRLCDNLDPSANIRLINPTLGRRETEDALAAVGLAGCLRQPARELSGGMRRRVAILRALLAEYDLLFLDEPF